MTAGRNETKRRKATQAENLVVAITESNGTRPIAPESEATRNSERRVSSHTALAQNAQGSDCGMYLIRIAGADCNHEPVQLRIVKAAATRVAVAGQGVAGCG